MNLHKNWMKIGTFSKHILLLTFLLVWTSQLRSQQFSETDSTSLDYLLPKHFSGLFGFSILIATNNKIIFKEAYGYIDILKTKNVDQKTLFNIASITKSFTAIAILRLVEQGEISLSDTIGKFIDNVPADKRSIAIHHLLSHTSGFKQNYVSDGLTNSHEAITAVLKDTLGYIPGSSFSYSNQNFQMLAIIIEKITSIKYEDFIRREILKPLKMRGTYFWNEVNNKNNIAGKNEVFPDSLTERNWGYIGSGGIYSTPIDLYKFWQAIIGNKLISKNNTEKLFKNYYQTSSGINIGFGWYINDTTEWNSSEIWTRGSESWGHNAVIRWFPAKKTVIIVCTNSGEMGDRKTTGNRIISNYIADFLWN